MAYPTTSELSAFLTANGITVGETVLSQAVNGAIAAWEEATNYRPFYSASSTAVYDFYDPPQRDMLPVKGYVSLTAVYYNVTATRDSGQSTSTISASNNGITQSIVMTTPSGTVSLAGVLATPFVDYWPEPLGEATAGVQPVTALRWGAPLNMLPRSILVYGRRGYCSTLAAHHYNAILQGAACFALVADSNKASRGYKQISLGDLDVEWQGAADSTVSAWRREFLTQAQRVRRVTC